MMITDAEFLNLHHQRSAELRARAAAYRLARTAPTPSPSPRRVGWAWLTRRQRPGVPARAALR
jgi:hypothetical protein